MGFVKSCAQVHRIIGCCCLQVEHISAGAATGQMRVRAKLKETGTLYAANGKRADEHAYSNPYSVEYTMQQADGKSSWLLANVLVVGGK